MLDARLIAVILGLTVVLLLGLGVASAQSRLVPGAGGASPAIGVAQLSGTDAGAPLAVRKDNRPLFAAVRSNGTLAYGSRVVSTTRIGLGRYEVVFDRDIRGACALTATEWFPTVSVCLPTCPLPNTVAVNTERTGPQQPADTVNVVASDPTNTRQDAAFFLVATCP